MRTERPRRRPRSRQFAVASVVLQRVRGQVNRNSTEHRVAHSIQPTLERMAICWLAFIAGGISSSLVVGLRPLTGSFGPRRPGLVSACEWVEGRSFMHRGPVSASSCVCDPRRSDATSSRLRIRRMAGVFVHGDRDHSGIGFQFLLRTSGGTSSPAQVH